MAITFRPHGSVVRGLTLDRGSVQFGGSFGRIFRALPAADFGDTDEQSVAALDRLGDAMSAGRDDPKDGPDAEESDIPALFTYFGQFVDHDLTFDPASSLQRQNDPDGLVDFRTPRFDLDSVYGRGPADQPYLYADGLRFLEGEQLTGTALGRDLVAHDLPRNRAKAADPANAARAIIGDPRNDENVIVSQLQGLFLRFHNRMVETVPGPTFEKVQREVRFHYQWVVVHDFLPRIVTRSVLQDVFPNALNGLTDGVPDAPALRFYEPRYDAFMPLEFAVAAYRFGHSMIRPGYRLNDDIGPLPIFPFEGDPAGSALTGFDEFPSPWAIDWARFLDLESRPPGSEPAVAQADSGSDNWQRTQMAYRIDTSLVNPLHHLPPRVAGDPPPSLAGRNLRRGWRLRLPSGQDVARAVGVPVLPDAEIKIGKFTGDAADEPVPIVDAAGGEFAGNCPLWTYVLAESRLDERGVPLSGDLLANHTPQLGPVGGRIVAETILGILARDSSSYLNQDPLWRPSAELSSDGKWFGLRELVAAAVR